MILRWNGPSRPQHHAWSPLAPTLLMLPVHDGACRVGGCSSLKANGNGVGKDMRETRERTQFFNGSSRFEVAPTTTTWRAAGLEALTPRQRPSADGSDLAGPLLVSRCVFSCACFGIRMTNFTTSQISSHNFLASFPVGGQLVFTTICTCFPTTPRHAPTTPPRTPTTPRPHPCARSRPSKPTKAPSYPRW